MSLSQRSTERVSELCGVSVRATYPLSGGCIGEVYEVHLADKTRLVAKVGEGHSSSLSIEGRMLEYLGEHSTLPVPTVLHADDSLLLMDYIEGTSQFSAKAARHAAELLCELHSIAPPEADSSKLFGLNFDTLIGGLPQPNQQSSSWLEFYAEHRLRSMSQSCERSGRLPKAYLARVEGLIELLPNIIPSNCQPSLIHGDLWSNNILAQGSQITGFIDPALYYADPEIELAMTTLFHTFPQAFFERYSEIRPISSEFYAERQYIYQLYPLLVHVRLFGEAYVQQVSAILERFSL